MKQGRICIYWEIKTDHFVAAVEMDEDTKRLPLVMRRHIVTRLREMLIPAKGDRRSAEGVGPYDTAGKGMRATARVTPTSEQIGVPGEQIGVFGDIVPRAEG